MIITIDFHLLLLFRCQLPKLLNKDSFLSGIKFESWGPISLYTLDCMFLNVQENFTSDMERLHHASITFHLLVSVFLRHNQHCPLLENKLSLVTKWGGWWFLRWTPDYHVDNSGGQHSLPFPLYALHSEALTLKKWKWISWSKVFIGLSYVPCSAVKQIVL